MGIACSRDADWIGEIEVKRALVVLLALAAFGLLPQAAHAAGPAKGVYVCSVGGGMEFFGNGKYWVNDGPPKGKFTYKPISDDQYKGKIKFKTGAYKGFDALYGIEPGYGPYIDLFDSEGPLWSCGQ